MATNTAPVSVAVTKRLLWGSFGYNPTQVSKAESDLHMLIMGEADSHEGVMAHLERREPNWSLSVNDKWPPEWPAPEEEVL